MSAREVAYQALTSYRKSGVWSELALDTEINKYKLDKRDAAFATRLCMGILQNLYLLDWRIGQCSNIKQEKLQPQIIDILRLGAYQILFMDRVPVSAAVDESVKLAKKYSNGKAAGFVNAVLRKISSFAINPPKFESTDEAETLSICFSHPKWLCKKFISIFGYEKTKIILSANNTTPATTAQINTIIGNEETISREICAEYSDSTPHPQIPSCLEIKGIGKLSDSSAFKRGLFYVQDAAARTAVIVANPKPGDTVIDSCAAPGGKSFSAAMLMKNCGRIISCDIHKNKLIKISDGATRLRIGIIETYAIDAKLFNPEFSEIADLVIADVPCSGFGVIRKKPEIRYKSADEISGLPNIQLNILKNQSRYVKPGGTLLYSTCTLLREENEDVVLKFLSEYNDFELENFTTCFGASKNGMITLLPGVHGTDGFFICKIRRKTWAKSLTTE